MHFRFARTCIYLYLNQHWLVWFCYSPFVNVFLQSFFDTRLLKNHCVGIVHGFKMSGESTWYSEYTCENKNCKKAKYNALNAQLIQQTPCPTCGGTNSPSRARVCIRRKNVSVQVNLILFFFCFFSWYNVCIITNIRSVETICQRMTKV